MCGTGTERRMRNETWTLGMDEGRELVRDGDWEKKENGNLNDRMDIGQEKNESRWRSRWSIVYLGEETRARKKTKRG